MANPNGLRTELRFPKSEKVANPVGIGRHLLLHSTEPRSSFTSQALTFCAASQQNALVRFVIIVEKLSGYNPGLLPFFLKDSPLIRRLRHLSKQILDFGLTFVLNLRLYLTRDIVARTPVRLQAVLQKSWQKCQFFCFNIRGTTSAT